MQVKQELSSKYGDQYTEQQITKLVNEVSNKYQVNASEMLETIRCESMSFKNIQSGHYQNGVREDSWGLSQINMYWHPEVSKEQALDPYFAVDFMGKQFSKGKQSEWTCYRNLF